MGCNARRLVTSLEQVDHKWNTNTTNVTNIGNIGRLNSRKVITGYAALSDTLPRSLFCHMPVVTIVIYYYTNGSGMVAGSTLAYG